MARSGGVKVVLKKVIRGKTRAFPFLAPGLEVGKRALRIELKRAVATLSGAGLNTISLRKRLDDAVEIAAVVTEQAAKRKVRYQSGDLRRSINKRKIARYVWSVGTGLPYGKWLEEGTKGGKVIYPKTKKALSFVWKNAPAGVRARFGKHKRKRR